MILELNLRYVHLMSIWSQSVCGSQGKCGPFAFHERLLYGVLEYQSARKIVRKGRIGRASDVYEPTRKCQFEILPLMNDWPNIPCDHELLDELWKRRNSHKWHSFDALIVL